MTEEGLFNPHGRRHFRKRYSLVEVRWSVAVFVGLVLIAAWVAWRGAHPDPALADMSAALLTRPASIVNRSANRSANRIADRGPTPAGLAVSGFAEASVASFDADRLYEKVNGREGLYKSFGFRKLYTASLTAVDDPTVAVDLELYDLGSAKNALGAYAGERGAEAHSTMDAVGIHHRTPNALFMTRGRYYIRAIGSSADAAVARQLEHLQGRLVSDLRAGTVPWAYHLFVGSLDIDPGKVAYHSVNAYSFEFARDVYGATLADGETDLFVVATPDVDAARQLAEQFNAGFLSYGSATKVAGSELPLVKDRYIGSFAAATHVESVTFGVRGAPLSETARRGLADLRRALSELPGSVLADAAADARRRVADRSPESDVKGNGEPSSDAQENTGETADETTDESGDPTYE